MKLTVLSCLTLICIFGSCRSKNEAINNDQRLEASKAQNEVDASTEAQMLSAPSAENIIDALKESGIHICNINLPKIELEKYKLILYRDTYLNGVKSTHPAYPISIDLKPTTGTTSKNKYSVVLTLIDRNDSLLAENWQLPGKFRTSMTNKKDKQHFIDYNVTPFKSQQIVPGKKVPVLLFGSSWKDEKTGFLRYCMERELEPDFSNDALDKMPGYYVYSIELKPKK